MKRYFGIFIISLLALIPAALWFMMPAERFISVSDGLADLGKLAGLIGAALFAINLIFSSHSKILDKIFGGLNKVYWKHALIGKIAVILLILHLLLLSARYLEGNFSGVVYFLSFGPLSKTFGQISLLLLLVLAILTIYWRPKYNIWKISHKFMGLAFFLAFLHMFFIRSDMSQYMPLRAYMFGLAGIGLAAFLYHTVFGWLLIKKYEYKVAEVKKLNNNVSEINMEPVKKAINFKAGQFVFIKFLDKNIRRESHPFSVSSAPGDKYFSIVVKNLGDHTAKIKEVMPGTSVKIEGPFGAFDYKSAANKSQIWIAGGIGITPFLSMAKSLKISDGYKIDLYYCVKNEIEAVYLGLLQNISASLNNHFQVIPVYSEDGFRVDADFVQKTSGRLSSHTDIFLCAPPAMIAALKEQFIFKGVAKNLIHSEEFNF